MFFLNQLIRTQFDSQQYSQAIQKYQELSNTSSPQKLYLQIFNQSSYDIQNIKIAIDTLSTQKMAIINQQLNNIHIISQQSIQQHIQYITNRWDIKRRGHIETQQQITILLCLFYLSSIFAVLIFGLLTQNIVVFIYHIFNIQVHKGDLGFFLAPQCHIQQNFLANTIYSNFRYQIIEQILSYGLFPAQYQPQSFIYMGILLNMDVFRKTHFILYIILILFITISVCVALPGFELYRMEKKNTEQRQRGFQLIRGGVLNPIREINGFGRCCRKCGMMKVNIKEMIIGKIFEFKERYINKNYKIDSKQIQSSDLIIEGQLDELVRDQLFR